ncbi:MAG: NAD(+) diphosphatase [Clostridiales bacterium]|nr:NAD(+) diphosphatase [Clostridiales bacterium]
MIQDLAPLHFDNTYHLMRPGTGDRVISMKDDKVLITGQLTGTKPWEGRMESSYKESGGSEGGINLPRFKELPELFRRERTFTYLFSISGERYFLCRDLDLDGYRYEKGTALRGSAPQHLVYAALVGMQLGRWYDAHRFCGACGHPMTPDEREGMMRCPSCGQMVYPKICPCVIVGVIHEGKILVSHYRGGFTDHYALIAGFAEIGETIEETVIREVYEETKLHVKNLRYYKSQPWPYSDSLLFGFFAELDGTERIVIQEDELSMAKWVTPEEIFEKPNHFSLTNEMLCRFKEEYGGA